MTLEKTKLNIFLSTLNFLLIIVGYQLATSILLPVSSDIDNISQSITIPYRAFAFVVSAIVILINLKKSSVRFSVSLKLLLVYWLILIIRIFYDLFFGKGQFLQGTGQLWLYIYGICLPAMFSIIKSYSYIDFDKALKGIILCLAFMLLLTMFSNQLMFTESDTRVDANIALNTIQYGHMGTTLVLLGLFVMVNRNKIKINRIILSVFITIGFYSMLRAGSRGPVLALVLVSFLWLFASRKKIIFGLVVISIAVLLFIFFMNPILQFIGNISPIIEQRLRMSIYEGDTSDRNPLYLRAWEIFVQNPIFGGQFAFFDSDGTFLYSHNIIFDSFMGMGFLGGLIMIILLISSIIKSFVLIHIHDSSFWLVLLLFQQIVANMLSGAFYYNPMLSALLACVFIHYNVRKNNIYVPNEEP